MNNIRTLIIYDKSGAIITSSIYTEDMKLPEGVPYIIVDVPAGFVIEKIDITTQTPIYKKDTIVISEIDKINSKMDYIAMMSYINIGDVADAGSYTETSDRITGETHSKYYNKVLNYCLAGLWTLTAVSNAVDKWITSAEFAMIVKAYNIQMAPDQEHKIETIPCSL